MTMARPVITLTSDLGRQDWFVIVLHSTFRRVCPGAHIAGLSHGIPHGHLGRVATRSPWRARSAMRSRAPSTRATSSVR